MIKNVIKKLIENDKLESFEHLDTDFKNKKIVVQ